jgi:nicotinamidase-related amidase
VTNAGDTRLDPARSALVIFDMLERYRPAIEAAGAIEPARTLIQECRALGVPVLYARADHRADGKDLATALTDTDAQLRPWGEENPRPTRPPHGAGSPELQVIAELAPRPGDYDIPKHRWSAFYQTSLDLSLRTRGIDTVMIIGGSTHVGIASTVYAGRDMDYNMVVVRDACTGFEEQREFFLERVFPRMCRVRSVAEAIAMLRAGASEPEMGKA